MEKAMYTVYKITNKKNGKAYVGFDSNWPSRKAVHICEAVTRKNKQYPLYRAIAKYGVDNFEWEILYQSDDRDHTLNVIEEQMIKKHNTHFREGHGYNMTYGGEGTKGWVPTEETRKNISEANMGKKAWNKGKPSPWTTKRNKEGKGGKQPKLLKTYTFLNPDGKLVTFTGLIDFCKINNLHAGNMCSLMNGSLKQYKGWKSPPK
jgi:group I intron endonuclease